MAGSKGSIVGSGVLPTPVGTQVALVGDTHANKALTRRLIGTLGAEGVVMAV